SFQILSWPRLRSQPLLSQLLSHLRRIKHLLELFVPTLQNRSGRSARSKNGKPIHGVEIGVSRLGDGGYIGQKWRTGGTGRGQSNDFSGFQVGLGGRRRSVIGGDALSK